jgi:hypothetical protein
MIGLAEGADYKASLCQLWIPGHTLVGATVKYYVFIHFVADNDDVRIPHNPDQTGYVVPGQYSPGGIMG